MAADVTQLHKNIILMAGYGLAIGVVLRLVTQPGSSLLFTLAVGFGAGLVPVATLVVVFLALILGPQSSPKRPGEREGFYKMIVILIYVIVCGGPPALFGLSLAVFILGLDVFIGQPFASQLGWVLSGSLYGVIWGLAVTTWFKLHSRGKGQA